MDQLTRACMYHKAEQSKLVVSGGNFPGRPLQCLPTVPKNRNCSSRTAATPMPFLLTGMALNLNFMAFERGVLQGRLFVYVNAVMHTHTPNILFSEVWLWAGEKIVLGLLS